MPVAHIPMDNSIVVASSVVMSIITFVFCSVIADIKPGFSLIIGVAVGVVLYIYGIVPIGLLAVLGFGMLAAIFKSIFSEGNSSNED